MKLSLQIPGHRKGLIKGGLALLILCLLVTFSLAELRGLSKVTQRGDVSLEEFQGLLNRVDGSMARIQKRMEMKAPELDLGSAPVRVAEEKEPVVKLPTLQERVDKLRLDGVAWNPQVPVAFVNSELVMVDTMVEGLRVVLIEEERVRFEDAEGMTADILLYEKIAPSEVP